MSDIESPEYRSDYSGTKDAVIVIDGVATPVDLVTHPGPTGHYQLDAYMNNQPPITLADGRDVEADLRKLVADANARLLNECRAFPTYDPFGEDPTPEPIQQAVDHLTICKAHLAECLRVKQENNQQ